MSICHRQNAAFPSGIRANCSYIPRNMAFTRYFYFFINRMYRWRSLPRVCRHRASKHQGSYERVLPWQVAMDQLICASVSHTHYRYEVGMLKVPAVKCRKSSPLSQRRKTPSSVKKRTGQDKTRQIMVNQTK